MDKTQDSNRININLLIKNNDFDKVFEFIKSRMSYLFSTLENYVYIYASSYENYYSFARFSPSFINMNEYSMISSFITVLINLVSKDTVVGIHTLIKMVKSNNVDNQELLVACDELKNVLKNEKTLLKNILDVRNKLICHFDNEVLDDDFVKENASKINIAKTKSLLLNIESKLAHLKTIYKNDGVYDCMEPFNHDDARYIKSVLDTFVNNKKEILKLKSEKRMASFKQNN